MDEDRGEFWEDNPFMITENGNNLSAFETNRVFINKFGTRFIDASFASVASIDSDSRSVIAADFDNDHRPDLLVASVGGGPYRLFGNQFPGRPAIVEVDLVGVTSNRFGIGCRLSLVIGDRRIVRDVFANNSFQGQQPPETIIGLGAAKGIDRLTVTWPTGESQTFDNVPVNGTLRITEGSGSFEFHEFDADPDAT